MATEIPPPKKFRNGKNVPLSQRAGMVPQLQGAIQNYYQTMTFILVAKYLSAGILVESGIQSQTWMAPDGTKVQGQMVKFHGVIVFRERELEMKKEGQRRWSQAELFSEPSIQMQDDDAIIYGVNNTQYRVMRVLDMSLYGFMRYYLKEDFKFAGPLVQVVQDPDQENGGDQPVDDGSGNEVIM